jgi:hypothetical protein
MLFGEGGSGISAGWTTTSSMGVSGRSLGPEGEGGSGIDLKSSPGPGEGIVNPVRGVGGVEDRLVSGDIDMIVFGSAKEGPPSSSEVIRSISERVNESTGNDATRS